MISARRLHFASLVGFVVLSLSAMTVASSADAAVPTPTAFELLFSPSARVLGAYDTPHYYEVKYDESCDNPHLRIRARNKPAIMIENAANSAAPITSFTLQINQSPYFFGTGDAVTDNFDNFIKKTIYSDAGVIITGSSVSPDAKTLTVTFDGLSAGKKAVFNIDLDTSSPNMFMYPDYRSVLFGAPLTPGGSPTTPATASATFTNNTAAPNTRTLSLNLPQETQHPKYMNEDIRPYHAEDKMEVIKTAIPEPTGVALSLAGFGALAALRRKGRAA